MTGEDHIRLRAVLEAGVVLDEETSLDGVLLAAAGLAIRLTGARTAVVGTLAPDGEDFDRVAAAGPDGAPPASTGPYPRRGSLLGAVADADGPPRAGFLGVPVRLAGELIGALAVADRADGEPFTAADEDVLAILARQAASAMARIRAQDAERTRAAQLQVLGQLGETLMAGAGRDELIGVLVHHMRVLVGARSCAIGLFEHGGHRIVAAEGEGADLVLAHNPPLPEELLAVLRAGGSVRIEDMADAPEVEPGLARALGGGALLLAPLWADGRLLGALGVAGAPRGRGFSDEAERVATVFAHRAALALVISERVNRETVEAIVGAQEQERARIGRELHDGTGQELTAALLSLRRIQRMTAADPDAGRELAALRDLLAGSLRGVRVLSAMLAPPPLGEDGLSEALESLAAVMGSRGGVAITVEDGGLRITGPRAAALYRIAQEGLTNVVRHAGARTAQVRLDCGDCGVRLTVSDDGHGFDPSENGGVGLAGMRERARLLGGSVSVDAAPGRGTVVTAELPIR